MNITKIEIAIKNYNESWKLSDSILYDLCNKYPYHKEPQHILAKVLLIGRAYAASIERRKNKKENEQNESFYRTTVVNTLMHSEIDALLDNLKTYESIKDSNITETLNVHDYVTKLFNKISGINKRSLASKYLHFHMPNLFFIYDSRAKEVINKKYKRIKIPVKFSKYDNEYSKYYLKCFTFMKEIKENTEKILTPRELDNILLY